MNRTEEIVIFFRFAEILLCVQIVFRMFRSRARVWAFAINSVFS